MLSETVFTNEHVATADRFDCWRQLMRGTHAPVDLDSACADDFAAHQRLLELGGDVAVWSVSFRPVRFRRTPKLIRQSDPEDVVISFAVRGALGITRGDREEDCRPFGLCVVDTSQPVEVRAFDREGVHAGFGVKLPKSLLPLPWDRARRVIGHRFSGREGFSGLLTRFVVDLVEGAGGYRESDAAWLATLSVDLVAAMFAHALESRAALAPETVRRMLLLRIRSFIQRHLSDHDLSPGSVAAAHHISLSHLHGLFRHEGVTVAAWIRQQRLERARRDLADPALWDRPVGEIGVRWGFTSHASFTRAFSAAFGLAPREYRREARTVC
jgi:AraC-like DNA-binding protein